MESPGKVVDWNEARGFGFIQPLGAARPPLFFHIRDYRQDGRRPELGELVKFEARRQADGRWRAGGVHARSRRSGRLRYSPVPPA